MLSEEGKREIELMNQLLKAKSIKEVLDISNRLDWDVSEEEAREFLGLLTSDEKKEGQKQRRSALENRGDNSGDGRGEAGAHAKALELLGGGSEGAFG